MDSMTFTVTAAQREALQLAVVAAQDEWRRRAKVLGGTRIPTLETMATEIQQRLGVLATLVPILHRHDESPKPSDIAPYSDIDEGRERKYESPESLYGVGATF